MTDARKNQFWSANEQAAIDQANDEEVDDLVEVIKEARKLEELSRARMTANEPVEDPESLKLVSPQTIKRMEAELDGKKLLGLKVLSENGRRFSNERLLNSVLEIPRICLQEIFNVPEVVCNEDASLIYSVLDKRSPWPPESIPVICAESKYVAVVNIDHTAVDEDYISAAEVDRVMQKHGISEATVMKLREMAKGLAQQKEDFVKHLFFDIFVLPPSQQCAVDAMIPRKLDSTTSGIAVRLILPPEATENLAAQLFAHVIKHLAFVVFRDDISATDVDARFYWSFVWALKRDIMPDRSHRILFVFGKRTNLSDVAILRKHKYEENLRLREIAQRNYEQMLNSTIKKKADDHMRSYAYNPGPGLFNEKDEEDEEDEEEDDPVDDDIID